MELLQENGRGKSNAPMIMGIIGFVATIPGTLCAGCVGACTSTVEILGTGHSSGIGTFWVLTNLASAGAGLFFGIKSKATPRTSGAIMIVSAILTLLISFVTFNWFWGLIAVACFAIGGAISLTQVKSPETKQAQVIQEKEKQPIVVSSVVSQPANTQTQEQKVEALQVEEMEQPPTIALPIQPKPEAPPVVQNYSVNPPVQQYRVNEARASFESNQTIPNIENPQQSRLSSYLIWGLLILTVIVIIATLVIEFAPNKTSGKVVPAIESIKTTVSEPKPQTSIPSVTPTGTVSNADVSIGYVKTLKGSDLRMRKEPSEAAEILFMIPNG